MTLRTSLRCENLRLSCSSDRVEVVTDVTIFFRDKWLCHWCGMPTVFGPALRCIDLYVNGRSWNRPLAYYQSEYQRASAPLCDQLAGELVICGCLNRPI